MKQLLLIMAIGFLYSNPSLLKPKREAGKKMAVELKNSGLPIIGEKIQGDFNGDKKIDTAAVIKIKEGQGNPMEDGTPDEYQIQFPGNDFKPINAGCCDIRLVNEHDLNNDGTDEISIFQAPMNGCIYSMATYSFIHGSWKQIVKPFSIPTGCDEMSDVDLQKRIFKENKTIYYFYVDPNDENGKLVKKKVAAK